MMEVGKQYEVFWGKENPNNETIEVRAIVDEDWVVIRSWSEEKQRWRYRVEHKTMIAELEKRSVPK